MKDFWRRGVQNMFLVIIVMLFLACNILGYAYFDNIETQKSKTTYTRDSSTHHK